MPEPGCQTLPRAGLEPSRPARSRASKLWAVLYRAFGWWVPALFLAALVAFQPNNTWCLRILTAFLSAQIILFLWWVETADPGAHASARAAGALLVGALSTAAIGSEAVVELFLTPWPVGAINWLAIAPVGIAVAWAVASWRALRSAMAASRRAALLGFIAAALVAGALLAAGLELETARVLR